MTAKELVLDWFDKWEKADYLNLAISEDFIHQSPYGVIDSKDSYLKLVKANEKNFLGHRFIIHEIMEQSDRCCVRYTSRKGEFEMEVCEWHYIRDAEIYKIIAYYNIEGDISEERQLSDSEEYDKNV